MAGGSGTFDPRTAPVQSMPAYIGSMADGDGDLVTMVLPLVRCEGGRVEGSSGWH